MLALIDAYRDAQARGANSSHENDSGIPAFEGMNWFNAFAVAYRRAGKPSGVDSYDYIQSLRQRLEDARAAATSAITALPPVSAAPVPDEDLSELDDETFLAEYRRRAFACYDEHEESSRELGHSPDTCVKNPCDCIERLSLHAVWEEAERRGLESSSEIWSGEFLEDWTQRRAMGAWPPPTSALAPTSNADLPHASDEDFLAEYRRRAFAFYDDHHARGHVDAWGCGESCSGCTDAYDLRPIWDEAVARDMNNVKLWQIDVYDEWRKERGL